MDDPRAVGRRAWDRAGALALVLVCAGCLADNPDGHVGGGDGGTVDGGLLSCEGAGCRLVIVSQTLDDRVDVFEVPAEGSARWRGAIDVDLKPNPGGDISGAQLDEPLIALESAGGLELLVGHYPSRGAGSLLRFGPDALSQFGAGGVIETSSWWRDGNPVPDVGLVGLDALEPVDALEIAPGRKLIAVFNNDLFEPETGWDGETELLLVDDVDAPARVDLSGLLGGACRGGWGLAELSSTHVAVACDGDEGVAIVDVSGARELDASLETAAESLAACYADIGFDQKRVRHLADDGEGGVVVTESPIVATGEDARVWHFGADCELLSLGTLPGPEVWDLRQIVRLPSQTSDGSETARWLVARGRTAARGLYVLAEGADGIEVCGALQGLDQLWSSGPEVVDPVALAVSEDGRHVAVTAGPTDYANAAPGHGLTAWVSLPDADPCGATVSYEDLGAAAPPVDPAAPQTWSRGPNDVIIVEP